MKKVGMRPLSKKRSCLLECQFPGISLSKSLDFLIPIMVRMLLYLRTRFCNFHGNLRRVMLAIEIEERGLGVLAHHHVLRRQVYQRERGRVRDTP